MRRLRLRLVLLFLCEVGLLTAKTRLSAQQYTRADDIYRKVLAQCCLRKSGALKIHAEIEQRIAAGETDETILVDLSHRLGGGPVQSREDIPAPAPLLAFVAIAGLVLAIRFLTRQSADNDITGARSPRR